MIIGRETTRPCKKLVEVMFANEPHIDSESLLLEGPESDPVSLCSLRLRANLPSSVSELGSHSNGLSLESGFCLAVWKLLASRLPS